MASDEPTVPASNYPTITCAHCGTVNPLGNRFCGGCGQPLVATVAPTIVPIPADPVVLPQEPPIQETVVSVHSSVVSVIPSSPPPVADVPATNTSVTPAPVVASVTAPSPPSPLTPADRLARERERDRLLTLANVQRMRGQSGDARKTLEQALELCEGMPGRELAPTYELIGDLYDAEARWGDARQAYEKAHELDPQRAGAERKYAALTLRLAEIKSDKDIAEALLRGDSLAGLMTEPRGRRNAGIAMLLSTVIPGFGQFYNGEFVKGAVVLGTFCATLLYFAITPERDAFVGKFASILAFSHGRRAESSVSAFSVLMGVLLVAVWLFSIVDAPFRAAKTPQDADAGPLIDKTGWEV